MLRVVAGGPEPAKHFPKLFLFFFVHSLAIPNATFIHAYTLFIACEKILQIPQG